MSKSVWTFFHCCLCVRSGYVQIVLGSHDESSSVKRMFCIPCIFLFMSWSFERPIRLDMTRTWCATVIALHHILRDLFCDLFCFPDKTCTDCAHIMNLHLVLRNTSQKFFQHWLLDVCMLRSKGGLASICTSFSLLNFFHGCLRLQWPVHLNSDAGYASFCSGSCCPASQGRSGPTSHRRCSHSHRHATLIRTGSLHQPLVAAFSFDPSWILSISTISQSTHPCSIRTPAKIHDQSSISIDRSVLYKRRERPFVRNHDLD